MRKAMVIFMKIQRRLQTWQAYGLWTSAYRKKQMVALFDPCCIFSTLSIVYKSRRVAYNSLH